MKILQYCRIAVRSWHTRCPRHEPVYRALLIGLNYKQKSSRDYPTLGGCIQDVGEVKKLLIGVCLPHGKHSNACIDSSIRLETMGWLEDEITTLTDDRPEQVPTKKNMVRVR
jgi:hypothetical protein